MPTDEVLNRLITEKVMGRVLPRLSIDVFDFQGFVEGAWLVIEKMLERGFSPTVNHNGPPGHFTHSPDWAGPWHCCFHNTKGCLHCGDESCKCYSHAEADTPARAICLAALKARGVEVSDAD